MSNTLSGRIAKALLVGAAVAGSANAAEVLVNSNISTSTTWTASNTYNLQQQIYVLPGATLTIEEGTVVASTTNLGGSLAVCRGAKIYVKGSQSNPVIMTSLADVATWVGGNPKDGAWREGANEWGNLTVMGNAYVSENAVVANSATPNAANYALMEGLVPADEFDTKTRYGGGNDDDDSGQIQYLSLRFGGKVIDLNNELNGLSLGGIGRETDIHHIDIMNNVDDGIEIWGGTVNIKYFNVWNIGDDTIDVDQGYRGKIQFGLIVQGYSRDAASGSGVGDNAFEMDGAEQCDYQPVTSTVVYNVTVIGQPNNGASDHGTAWRDNARVQYRNCIFMDLGERLVSADNTDGDGGLGYGCNGTTSWAATWTTAYDQYSTVNAPGTPADFYKAQIDGRLAEITDSVMFNNNHAQAYTEANNRDVFNALNNNVLAASSPIQSIVRAGVVVKGGTNQEQVIALDPRPANDALVSVSTAPDDGFFTSAQYRGGFHPDENWLCNWTAADAFGFVLPAPGGCLVGPSVDGVGARYLSVTPAASPSDAPVALRISSPKESCVSKYLQTPGAFGRSALGDTAVFLTPAQWGTAYPFGLEVIPSTKYHVHVELADRSSLGCGLTYRWGDAKAHNNLVNLDDILCILSAFSGSFTADCTRYSTDLVVTSGYIINLDDILAVLSAFGNPTYNGADPCP